MTTRVILDLASDDEKAVIRVLRAVLKAILRRHGVRCTRIEPVRSDGETV